MYVCMYMYMYMCMYNICMYLCLCSYFCFGEGWEGISVYKYYVSVPLPG